MRHRYDHTATIQQEGGGVLRIAARYYRAATRRIHAAMSVDKR